jgi:glutaredoxin
MITIEVMTQQDCCLCEEAKAVIEQVIRDIPAKMKLTDIESDPELFKRYKEKIPVVLINGEESFVYKVHPVTLRKKLDKLLEAKG